MAGEAKQAPAPAAESDLDELAFQLFSARVAANPYRRVAELEAAESYRLAESFLSVRRKVRAGELKPKERPTGPQLADHCAPNLPHSHPLNLVAATYQDKRTGKVYAGDLGQVGRIHRWLASNPPVATEDGDVEIVEQFNREFPELSGGFPELRWGLPQINIARAVFPKYAMKN